MSTLTTRARQAVPATTAAPQITAAPTSFGAPVSPPAAASPRPPVSIVDWWAPLGRVLRMLRLPVRRTLAAVAAGALALCCAAGLTATSAWLITRAAEQPPVLDLSVAVVAVRALGLGRAVVRYVERIVSHDIALRGVVDLRVGVYRLLAAADVQQVTRWRRGALLARLGADVDSLADLVVRALLPIAVAVVTSAAVVVLAAAVLPAAGAVLAVSLLLAGVGSLVLAGVAARRVEEDAARARGDVADEVLALLDGADELVVAGQLEARLHDLALRQASLDAVLDRAARPAAAAAALVQAATGAAVVISLVVAVPAVAAGELGVVAMAVVCLLPLAAFESVALLPAAATSLVRCRASAARVLALAEAEPPEDRGTRHRDAREARALRRVAPQESAPQESAPQESAQQRAPQPVGLDHGGLRARGLRVGWPGAPVLDLPPLDLDVAPGRSLAVLGPSGCGKSTLLLTLAGLLAPRAGTVTAAGSEPHHGGAVGPDDARRVALVALAAEDGHVFGTTLRENLRLAAGDVPDAELAGVLDRVGLGPWWRTLPEGLSTVLGPGGIDVSGGERRRVLVARALLTGAPVLLLDEPTEHLDEAAADALLTDLLAAADGRSVVVVTHRRSAAALADAVLDLGRFDA